MTCEIVGTERALFVTWGTPQIEDFERIVEQVRLHSGGNKASVFYVTRVPCEAPAPDGEVRHQLNRRLPTIVEYCMSYHVILEGDGFAAAMKRGVLLSLFQLTQKRGMFYVHATLDAFKKKVPVEWRDEVNRLLVLAAHRDMLEGRIASDRVRDGSGSFRVDREKPKKSSNSHVA